MTHYHSYDFLMGYWSGLCKAEDLLKKKKQAFFAWPFLDEKRWKELTSDLSEACINAEIEIEGGEELAPNPGGLIRLKAAAKQLGFNESTIRNKLSDGSWPLKCIRVGGSLRFRQDDVDQIIEAQETEDS